jgi:hypothetical protein
MSWALLHGVDSLPVLSARGDFRRASFMMTGFRASSQRKDLSQVLRFGFLEMGRQFSWTDRTSLWEVRTICFWLVVPPLWFVCELYGQRGRIQESKENFDRFKYGQELASRLWVALGSALLILFFGKDIAAKVLP